MIVNLKVVWLVASAPAWAMCANRLPCAKRAKAASTAATKPIAANETRAENLLLTLRKIAMARIGKSSPMAPDARK